MGASNSHDVQYEDARKFFSDIEQTKLDEVFTKISTRKHHDERIEKQPFQSYTSWLLPEQVSQRLFNEICKIQATLVETQNNYYIKRHGFIVALSKFLKQSKEDKASIFYAIASGSSNITKQDIADLCQVILNAYVTVIKTTSIGVKINANNDDNQRFVNMSVHELDKDNKLSSIIVSDVLSWFSRFPLIEYMFCAVLKALFIDIDSIIVSNSLAEGCEETVQHVHYDRSDILFPHKLEVNFEETNSVLDIPSILAINASLPVILRHQWRLLFSTKTHGESFQSMLHQIMHQGPTILVVKDTDGHVFGGFAACSWAIRSQFEGDSTCFLFSIKPSLAVYNPTGYNTNFMYLNHNMQTLPNGMGMGGQLNYFALWLDEDFGTGHSKGQPSTTYGNPRLSANECFTIDDLEVWGVGVPPEQQLKDRSVLDTEIEAKAFLEVTGKQFHSEGIREPDPNE